MYSRKVNIMLYSTILIFYYNSTTCQCNIMLHYARSVMHVLDTNMKLIPDEKYSFNFSSNISLFKGL